MYARVGAERTTGLNLIFNWEDFTYFFSVAQVNIILAVKSRACSKSSFLLPSGIAVLLFIVISGPQIPSAVLMEQTTKKIKQQMIRSCVILLSTLFSRLWKIQAFFSQLW